MSTKPAVPQRWPRNAEAQRRTTLEEASDALSLLGEARRELRRNPLLAELQIADAQQRLERIRRLLIEARVGVEAPGDPR